MIKRKIMREKKPEVQKKQEVSVDYDIEQNFEIKKDQDELEIVQTKGENPPKKVEEVEEEVKPEEDKPEVEEVEEDKPENPPEIVDIENIIPPRKTVRMVAPPNPDIEISRRTCPHCNKVFSSLWARDAHVNKRVCFDKEPWTCDCGARFVKKLVGNQLTVHLNSLKHQRWLKSQKVKEDKPEKVEEVKPKIVYDDFESRVNAEIDRRWKAKIDREERERKLIKETEDRVRKEYEEKLKLATSLPTIRGRSRNNPTFQRTASMVAANRRKYNFT